MADLIRSNEVDVSHWPSLDEMAQLEQLIAARRDQLRRDQLARVEAGNQRGIAELRELHELITAELRKHGLEWMKAHVKEVAPDGSWEKVVELWRVVWELPGYRPFKLVVAKWTQTQRDQLYDPDTEPTWKLAGDQTANECPSWEATDSKGNAEWCHTLIHALDVARIETLFRFGEVKVEVQA